MKTTTRIILLALGLASSACTTFDRAWSISSRENLKPVGGPLGLPPRTIPQSPFDGQWVGHWVSAKHHTLTGKPMSGQLLLALSKYDPYQYRANFRAYWRFFKTDYQVMLYGKQHGNVLHLHGREDVRPVFGGPYRYDGTVTPHRLTLNYESRYDEGTIELSK